MLMFALSVLAILLGVVVTLAIIRLYYSLECFSKEYEQCEILMLSGRVHNVCVKKRGHSGSHMSADKLTF